jgi:LysM repeat protein
MAATYVVQQGDTLSGIAQSFGISLADLEAANPQITNPDLIFPGQVINIPGTEPGDDGGGDGPKGKDDKEKDWKDKDKEGKEWKDKDKDHKDKEKDHKDKEHKDHKDKEHKDQKDHKDKEHKDHKEHHHEKHDHEKRDHEKQHEGHGGGGSGAQAVGLGSGGGPSVHFIGAELRPDLVHTTLRREPDLAGGAEGTAGHGGGAVAADHGDPI